MLTEERQRQILLTLNQSGSVQMRQLIDDFGASESTIRRDLTEMANAGLLRRVHGGAQRINGLHDEPGVSEKAATNITTKQAIARLAVTLAQGCEMIFLDAGTSTAQMIPLLAGSDITVVTPGVDNASLLADYGIHTILLGGTVKPLTKAVIGAVAAHALAQYRFDACFLGTNGVHTEYGLTTPDPEEAAIKRLAMQQSSKTVVLADSSKFDNVSFTKIADLSACTIITADFATIDATYHEFTNIMEAPQ